MSHKKYRTEKNCLNCGAEVPDKFCPACGQENIELRDSFFHMVGHFISDYLHYDSKFFKGLLPLFTKPGYLTAQYLQGKRVSNIHPLRLFFFSTILMVLVTSFYYNRHQQVVRNSVITTTTVEGPEKSTPEERAAAAKKSAEIRERLYGALDEFIHNMKYISFFMLPLYALVFWLLYMRRNTFYVDHLVFTLHLQSFIYIVATVLMLLPFTIAPGIVSAILLIYVTLALRFLYRQAWWKTATKAVAATALCVFLTSGIFVSYILAKGFSDFLK